MMDVDRVSRLIAHRCPEITPADLAMVEAALTGRDADAIPGAVAEKMIDVLVAIEERLADIEENVQARRRRGQARDHRVGSLE